MIAAAAPEPVGARRRRMELEMSRKDVVGALLREQGCLFSEEIGANIARDVPQQWFHWLLGALLLSARIRAEQAVQAAAALKAEGLHTIDAILAARRGDLTGVLNRNGYARFDNVGADRIRAAATLTHEEYGGDLRNLRDAGGDAAGIETRLKAFQGIGDAGAGIFCREAQLSWDALFPRADARALKAARELKLPDRVADLAQIAGGRERFVRLVSALTRVALDGPADAVRKAAS